MDLLNQVANIIPENCRVVLLGDGEFDGKLLRKQIQNIGWEYVLRTSKDKKVAVGCSEEVRFDQVGLTSEQDITFITNACENSNAIYWLGKGFDEPIYLLTNMDLADMACQYYRKRFKIELFFKQLKSAGFNLQKSMLESAERCSNLVMVLAFAFIFTFCMGLLVKQQAKKIIDKIYRFDRIEIIRPITLAQKCFQNHKIIAEKLFLQFTKQWLTFF